MISNKTELRQCLQIDYLNYIGTKKHYFSLLIKNGVDLHLWYFFKALRYEEYHLNAGHIIRKIIWERRRSRIGIRLGLFILPNCLDIGTKIWHTGNVIIHKDATVGKMCQFHGMNCIGNKGNKNTGVPKLGDNVNIGMGAVIIGDVNIADNVSIAANAVVTKSCSIEGAVLAGVPARIIQASR